MTDRMLRPETSASPCTPSSLTLHTQPLSKGPWLSLQTPQNHLQGPAWFATPWPHLRSLPGVYWPQAHWPDGLPQTSWPLPSQALCTSPSSLRVLLLSLQQPSRSHPSLWSSPPFPSSAQLTSPPRAPDFPSPPLLLWTMPIIQQTIEFTCLCIHHKLQRQWCLTFSLDIPLCLGQGLK